MGVVYAIANQKGGVGKTTTAVNIAACVADGGSQTLLVDLDPQCNATVALGADRDMQPSSYDCLTGEVSVAEAARPAGPDNLWLVPANRDLAGASVELPRLESSETGCANGLGPVRERFAVTVLDCPPSLGPVSVNALVAADRVIVPVQAEYLALEGLVQFLDTLKMIRRELNPRARRVGTADHNARRAHPPRPGRRARAARALPRDGLRDGDPAQRPRRRGAELRPAGDRARSLLARLRPPTGPSPRSSPPVAPRPRAAMAARSAPAWAAASPRSCPSPRRATPASCASCRSALVKPNPSQPRTHFDADALASLASSIETSGVVQPLLVRPLHDGSYELIAGERRWRAAQQAGLEKVPAVVRDSEQAERLQVALIENMVREDLNPVEEARACAALVEELGVSKEELARRVGRSRPAISNLIRLLDLPDEVLEPARGRRAQRGPRPGAARRPAATTSAAASAGKPLRHGWSVRETENRAKLASQPKRRGAPQRLDPEEAAALATPPTARGGARPRGQGPPAEGGGGRGRDPLRGPRRGARPRPAARPPACLSAARRAATGGRYHRRQLSGD